MAAVAYLLKTPAGSLGLAIAAVLACSACGNEVRYIDIASTLMETADAPASWSAAVQLAVDDANRGLQLAEHDDIRFRVRSEGNPVAVLSASQNVNLPDAAGPLSTVLVSWDTPAKSTSLCVPSGAPANYCAPVEGARENDDEVDASTDGWTFNAVASPNLDAVVLGMLSHQIGDQNTDGVHKLGVFYMERGSNALTVDQLVSAFSDALLEVREADTPFSSYSATAGELCNSYSGSGHYQLPEFSPDAIIDLASSEYSLAFAMSASSHPLCQDKPFLHARHARLSSTTADLLPLIEGHEGVSPILYDGASGDTFAAHFEDTTGAAVEHGDANAYDAAMVVMLAALVAFSADPGSVTPPAVRDALEQVGGRSGSSLEIGTGADEFSRAVGQILERGAVDYIGASGPMDFDDQGQVRGKLVHWRVQDQAFVDLNTYDCTGDATCLPSP